MLRSNGKQSGESVEKREATVGRICRKWRFQARNEREKGVGTSCATNQEQIEIMELEGYSQRTSNELRARWRTRRPS